MDILFVFLFLCTLVNVILLGVIVNSDSSSRGGGRSRCYGSSGNNGDGGCFGSSK